MFTMMRGGMWLLLYRIGCFKPEATLKLPNVFCLRADFIKKKHKYVW